MSAHGWKTAVVVSGLWVALAGCKSVPPIPEHARARGYTTETEGDGWLYRNLTGQEPAPSESGSPAGAGTSEIARTSAEEPVAPGAGTSGKDPALQPLLEPIPPTGKGYVVDEVEEEKGFELSDLAPTTIYKNLKAMAGYGPNEGVARALFQEGQDLYNQKQFAEAAEKFKSAAARWPDSPLEEDALFMLGESYFFADRYPRANDAYGQLLKKYEYTRHLDTTVKRLFAIGRYWEQLSATVSSWEWVNMMDSTRPVFDTFGYGIKAYDTVRLHDPTGPLADDSIMAAGNAYFVRGRFEEAAYQYDLIRKEYPKSEHQVKAHLLAIQSKVGMYQGPLYEGAPLKEAGEVAQQALTVFGRELGDERTRVVETKNKVNEELAMRDWSIGQYYDRRKYFGAARYYYQAVLEEHPQSEAARLAEARLEEIRGLPDRPPNRFKWLTTLFMVED